MRNRRRGSTTATLIMKCNYLSNDCCGVASGLVQIHMDGYSIECKTTAEACNACNEGKSPQSSNDVTASLAISNLLKHDRQKGVELAKKIRGLIKKEISSKMVKAYLDSTSKWIKQGRPERQDEEVASILKICESNKCGKYRVTANKSWCGSCGCSLSEGSAVVNKIRRATEHCPEGHW